MMVKYKVGYSGYQIKRVIFSKNFVVLKEIIESESISEAFNTASTRALEMDLKVFRIDELGEKEQ